MGDFRLVANAQRFDAEAKNAWDAVVPADVQVRYSLSRPTAPVLVAFYIIGGRDIPQMGRMTCVKEDAKRIVYPKTNRNRRDSNIFNWVGENMEEKAIQYASTVLKANRLSPASQEQKAYVDDLVDKARTGTGPGLISHRRYFIYPTGVEVADFFLITTEKARELVYYDNNIKKSDNQKVVSLSDYFAIILGSDGNARIRLLERFNTHSDIPRFTREIELELRHWEASAVLVVNSVLAAVPPNTPTADKMMAARIEFDKFYNSRLLRRADYVIMHPDTWVNRYNLLGKPSTDILIRDARERVAAQRAGHVRDHHSDAVLEP